MIKFIKQLFCNHDYEFVRNIYGDERNHLGSMNSEWRCKKCGHLDYRYTFKCNLADELNEINVNYRMNLYNEWIKNNQNILKNIEETCKKAASNGLDFAEFECVCSDKHNDKYNIQKWCIENGLNSASDLKNGDTQYKDSDIQKYVFTITW